MMGTIDRDRYLIKERHESKDYGTHIFHVWEFHYSDGRVERLRQWVKK